MTQFNVKVKDSSLLDSVAKEIDEELKKWEKAKREFDKKYEAAEARAKVNEQQLKRIREVEKRIKELKKLQMTNRNALTALGDPESVYNGLRAKWNALHVRKIQNLNEQCQQFSALSNGLIKADIQKSLDIVSLKQQLKTAFAGLNIKEQKVDDLSQCVLSTADPIATWNGILAELEKLALHETTGTDPLPTTAVRISRRRVAARP